MPDFTLDQKRAIAIASARARLAANAKPPEANKWDGFEPPAAKAPKSGEMVSTVTGFTPSQAQERANLGMAQMKEGATEAAKFTTQVGLRGAGGAAGIAMGGPAGGALGSMAGAALANKFTGTPNTAADLVSTGIAGGIPGGGSMVSQMAKFGAGNVAAKTAQTFLSEGRRPSGPEAAMAFGSGALGGALSSKLDTGKSASAIEAARKRAEDSLRRETVKIGEELGYVLPPSLLTKVEANSSMLANSLESVGGKAATAQQVTHMNQPITNRLVKEELGINTLKPLSDDVLEQTAKPYNDVYADIGSVSHKSSVALNRFKQANADSKSLFAQYQNNQVKDPAILAAAKKSALDADSAMQIVEQEAQAANKANLIPKFREARVKLAQIGLVKDSVNRATGDIDAALIGKAYEARQPLTGNLEKIGRFQNAFSKALAESASTPVPGVNQLARYAMPLAAGGAAATGGAGIPLGIAAGVATAAAPSVARKFMLSPTGQRFFQPNYGRANPSFLANFARGAAQQPGLNAQQFRTK